MSVVIGIDPSLSNTAVAVYDGSGVHVESFSSKPTDYDVRSRMTRIGRLAAGPLEIAIGYKPVLVLIEGYSMGSGGSAQHSAIVEYGGLLRYRLATELKCPIYEVAPTTLKKWATGKGNADKSEVVSAMTRLTMQVFKTNDESDAAAMSILGWQMAGLGEPKNQAQREAVATVLGVKTKKGKK